MILGQAQTFASPEEALTHISEAPWSNYTKADYTLEQWHAACVLHIHDAEPTAKSQCKCPVKTPDGTLNRHGVHAAAAALAGARGGLKGVSADQRSKAQNAIKRYYSQLDETPPESLTQSGIAFRQKWGSPEDVLEHYGKKGMRWGVRNEDEPLGRDASGRITVSPKSASPKPVVRENQEKVQPVLSERQQRRVDKFLKRSDVINTRISELKIENEKLEGSRKHAYTRYVNNDTIKQLGQAQQRAVKDAEAVKKGKLTSTQKKVIVGGVVVGGLLAGGYLATKVVPAQQSGAFNSYKLLSRQRLLGQKSPFAINKELTGPMSARDLLNKVAKPVNPLYSSMGGKMNCRRSTYAYELRRRGFDVRATTSAVGWGQSESGVINAVTKDGKDFFNRMSMSQAVVDTGFSSVAKGDTRVNPLKKILLDNLAGKRPSIAEMQAAMRANGGRLPADMQNILDTVGKSSSKKVLEELAKQPNGARGEVLFKFPQFGHSMAYEVVDGVPHIFDSQKGTLYNAATKMVESKWDGFHSAEITRLDNVDLDTRFLTRWATNTGKGRAPSLVENVKQRVRDRIDESVF